MLVRALGVAALLAAIGIAAWYLWPSAPPPPPSAPVAAPPPRAPVAQGPLHPIEPVADAPLPALKESDPTLVEALTRLLGYPAVQKFLDLEDAARKFVATVDNLPRESYATRLNPVNPIGGALIVSGRDDTLAIAPANAARYTAFVRMAEGVDTQAAIAAYKRLYPLFQQAYVDLGYPGGYFNDRLVAVIDHLLATPDIQGPLALTVPHVLYEFADPALQERSAGQKALLRMGQENAARLKAKLREVRRALAAAPAAAR